MIVCPSCGRESPDDALFCASCGTALAPRAQAREERKVVSVVFVDLVGHTSRSESADPEDVRATLAPYYERARAELERFGGTVEKFIGDAVMAVFGAPVTHEDDAERAVRAALAVRDAISEAGLDVRAAVNTGEALVALDARPADGQALVAGDVVNTAARLQTAAPVNGVLVGETTYRLTERLIEYREAEAVGAKGKAEPVPAWEAVQPRSRYGVDVAQHGGAELVGRDAERRLLRDAFERARREHSLQLVTLVGAPGIGKSRLVWELFRELDELEDLGYWRQGRAIAYGGGPFGAIADAVRAHAGALESDSPVEIEEKLAGALASLGISEEDQPWLLRRLQPLLGIETTESVGRDEAFAAWQRFFEAVADQRPLVLVLEDLHWADDGTLDFVDHLADWANDVALFVLCTARPELLERRPTWGGGRLNSHTVSLAPLDERATAELLGLLLGRPLLDADVQARLLQQSGGNPLYAEEFARMLGETGDESDLPDSVQGIIAARLDVLDSSEKALLQDASVLGKVFWRGGLVALGADETTIDELLHRLARKDFVRRDRGSTVAGDSELAFRHALVRDVAYGQIPRAARAEKHRLAAEWIAATAIGRADLVAHHYLQALELGRAAGADVAAIETAAGRALREAGDRARSVGALPEALELYRHALTLWPDESSRAHVLLAIAEVESNVTNRGAEEAELALQAFEAAGDLPGVAAAELVLADVRHLEGDTEVAMRHVERAIEVAEGSGARTQLAAALAEKARRMMLAGRNEKALEVADVAILLAEELGLEEVAVHALISRATSAGYLGLDGWREAFLDAAERASAASLPIALFRAFNNIANVAWRHEGVESAESYFQQSRAAAVRFPLPSIHLWNDSGGAFGAYHSGRWDDALEREESYFRATGGSPYYLDSEVFATRGRIRYLRGDDAGLADLERAVDGGRRVGDPQAFVPHLAALGVVYLQVGRRDDAVGLATELEELPPSNLHDALGASTDIGWLAHELDRRLDAETAVPSPWHDANRRVMEGDLAGAIPILDRIGARAEATFLRLELGKRLAADGRATDAQALLDEVESFAREVGAVRYLRELEALRLKSRSA